MDDKAFIAQCEQVLAKIEAAVETAMDAGADIDFDRQGGILEIECADASKIIISPHGIARELWVAARSGGFHFKSDAAGHWVDTRSGALLSTRLVEILEQQAGVMIHLS